MAGARALLLDDEQQDVHVAVVVGASRTHWRSPDVSPLHQYSWRLRLQNQVRPLASVRRQRVLVHPRHHQHLRRSPSSWTIAGTSPSASKATAAISASVRGDRASTAVGIGASSVPASPTAYLPLLSALRRTLRRGREARGRLAPDGRDSPVPPSRPAVPPCSRAHGDDRVDDWFWLRDRDDPDGARVPRGRERVHRGRARAPRAAPRAAVRGDPEPGAGDRRRPRRSATATHEYFRRTVEGRQYAVHCRRPAGTPGLPDPDAEPGTEPGRSCSSTRTSSPAGPSTSRSAGSRRRPTSDCSRTPPTTTGGERYELRFRDLDDRRGPARRRSPDVYYGLGLGERRPHRLLHAARRRHAAVAGLAPPTRHARQPTTCSSSRRTTSASTSASTAPAAARTSSSPRLEDHERGVARRRRRPGRRAARRRRRARDGVEYTVEHHADRGHGDRFFVLTNDDGAENFKLMVSAGRRARAASSWTEVVPHRPDVRLDDVDAFAGHLVLLRADGRARAARRPRPRRPATSTRDRDARPGVLGLGRREPRVRHGDAALRLHVARHARCRRFDYDLVDREAHAREATARARGYDPTQLETQRALGDGARRHARPDLGRAPAGTRARRHRARAALRLRRRTRSRSTRRSRAPGSACSTAGVVFAIAHVRGGGELGRALVRGRQARAQAQHVHRLHRARRAPDRRGLHVAATASRPGAAARAGS